MKLVSLLCTSRAWNHHEIAGWQSSGLLPVSLCSFPSPAALASTPLALPSLTTISCLWPFHTVVRITGCLPPSLTFILLALSESNKKHSDCCSGQKQCCVWRRGTLRLRCFSMAGEHRGSIRVDQMWGREGHSCWCMGYFTSSSCKVGSCVNCKGNVEGRLSCGCGG